MKSKTLGIVFVLAFFLNVAWENAHSRLYIHYRGGEITEAILVRAALFDAAVISVLALGVILTPIFRGKILFAVTLSILFAVSLERFALSTDRWAYTPAMPIIPLINTGLSPTIQLAATFLAALKIATIKKRFKPAGNSPAS